MNKFKIAIISDSHLIKNSPFLGIDTFKSFKAIIDNLVNNLDNYELVLFLGRYGTRSKNGVVLVFK